MLRNNEIIERLTTKQKIALLTDASEAEELRQKYDIPSMTPCQLSSDACDKNGELIFPSFTSLANSWDEELFGKVAQKIAGIRASEGNCLFVLPKTNSASCVYGSELTEDPFLAGKLYSSMSKSLANIGATLCMHAPTVSNKDISVLDKQADVTALFERVVRPFIMTRNAGKISAFVFTSESVEKSYQNANEKMINSTIKDDSARITNVGESDNVVAIINSGSQVQGASSAGIEAAYDNYNRIYHSMEEGGASAGELDMAILDGAAINDEIIDQALDQRISLATKQINGILTQNIRDIDLCAKESARRSIVLLKNTSDALPLKQAESVCVIGDIIGNENTSFVDFYGRLKNSLDESGINVIGYEKGYELEKEISSELVAPAINLASQADTILLFLGLGNARERELENTKRLTLPANQIELISKIKELKKNVIAIVSGSRLPCMRFDRFTNGALLIPTQGKYVAGGLGEILTGQFNPCAKLAYTGYNDIDTKFKEIQQRKQRGDQKIGQFIGYRYADGAGQVVKYPFGFGLSYSKCTYESMYLTSTSAVSLTICNNSDRELCETAQIYLGKNDPRTFKELKGFAKLTLKPRERKSVTINLEETKKYDEDMGSFVADGGSYCMYTGSSIQNIFLTQEVSISGLPIEGKGKITEYIHEISNIHSESYTMEAHCEPMNTASKLKNFSLWLMAITIFLDIVYGVCGLIFGLPFKDYLTIFISVNAGVFSFSALLLVIYLATLSSHKAKNAKNEKIARDELFKNAEKVDTDSVEKLFEVEFEGVFEKKQKKKGATYQGKDEALYVYMQVDTTLSQLASEMEAFFEENGLHISSDVARSTLASLMSSRLLVIRDKQNDNIIKFIRILSAFLGTKSTFEALTGRNWDKDTLLFKFDSMTEKMERTLLFDAFKYAQTNSELLCFYTMRDVKHNELERFLMPYVQFLGNPSQSYTVIDNETRREIPTNLWFVIAESENESIDEIPPFVANLASVIDINAQLIKRVDEIALNQRPITKNQMEALTYRSKKSTVVDENQWKMVDLLEEHVNQQTPYHIGNKLFLQLETYMAIYQTSGGSIESSMDSMVSNKLLTSILAMLKGKPSSELDLIQAIEGIFGEENVSKCTSLIKYPTISLMKNQPIQQETAKVEKTEPAVTLEPVKAEENEPAITAEPVKAEETEPTITVEPVKSEEIELGITARKIDNLANEEGVTKDE